jgi:hypothetical protein
MVRGRRPIPQRPADDTPKRFNWASLATIVFFGMMAMYVYFWLGKNQAVAVALIVVPLLLAFTTPLIVRASRKETGFDLGGLLAVGLLLRCGAAYFRFKNEADAGVYHKAGVLLARGYRHLHFGADPGSPVPGTGGQKIITGIVTVFTNSNEFATFLVFAWLGFLGCFFFYRAFVTAMPDADRYRYARLVFLWPTLVFWPSSIGKDSWMLFTLGIAALGAARIFVRKPGGYSLLLLGLLAGSFVRPHVSLLALVACAVALFVGRRNATRPGALTPGSIGKVAGLVVLIIAGGLLVSRSESLLNTNDTTASGSTVQSSSIDVALNESAHRTAQGGSVFPAANPRTPDGYAKAAVTILFRPFPTEVHGFEQLMTACEALFLLGLAIVSWRRLIAIPARLRADPYVTFAVVYILVFFFAFGTIGNFGILARQRSQVMPLVFVLLSVTPAFVAPRFRLRSAPTA